MMPTFTSNKVFLLLFLAVLYSLLLTLVYFSQFCSALLKDYAAHIHKLVILVDHDLKYRQSLVYCLVATTTPTERDTNS